jgi:hypothetical protein
MSQTRETSMSSHTQPPCTAVHARETLINWLALLVLLALGVSWSPADAGSAVDELRMQIGERTIVGQIRERAAARAAYPRDAGGGLRRA